MLISIKNDANEYVWREDVPGSGRKTLLLALLLIDELAPESLNTIQTLQQEQMDLERSEGFEVDGRKFSLEFKERYNQGIAISFIFL